MTNGFATLNRWRVESSNCKPDVTVQRCNEPRQLFSVSLLLRHSFHPLKKKIDVNTALVTNIANKDCTTAAVVA